MPDVVESRKQANTKSNPVKTDTNNTNGDDGTHAVGKSHFA